MTKTYKITIAYKDGDGRTNGKALFRVDAGSPEQAMEKLAGVLVNDGAYEVEEVEE